MKCPSAILATVILIACSGVERTADVPSAPAYEPAKLEPVYRSLRSLEAATGVGVSFIKFNELLQVVATEVSLARDRVGSDAERDTLTAFESSFKAYTDSATLWQVKMKASDDHWKGEIPVGFKGKRDPAMQRILEEYDLQPSERKMLGTQYEAVPGTAVSTIWTIASSRLAAAVKRHTEGTGVRQEPQR